MLDIPEDTLCPDSSEPTVVASETQEIDVKSTAEIATTSADDGVTIERSNFVVTTDEVTLANTNTIATTNAATNTVAGTENVDASNTAAINTETSAETNAIVTTADTVVISGSDDTSANQLHPKQSPATVFSLQNYSLWNLCSPQSWNKPRLNSKDATVRTEAPRSRKDHSAPVNAPIRSLETNATVSAILV